MEFKLINHFGKYLLFLPENLLLLEIDEEISHQIKDNDFLPPNIVSVVKPFIDNKICSFNSINFKPQLLVLTVSHMCNLKCVYCYAEEGTYHSKGLMNLETAKKAIEMFYEKGQSNVGISFFGGEPLINFSVIKKVVNFANSYLGKNIRFAITTNGTIITPEIATFFRKNNFSITLSLDGNQKLNDKLRLKKNKKGTYKDIIKAIEILHSSYKNDIFKKILLRATLTSKNDDFTNLMEFFSTLTIPFTVFLVSTNDNKLKPRIDELLNSIDIYTDKMIKLLKERNFDKFQKKLPNIIWMFLKILHTRQKRYYPCGAGRKVVVVNPKGDVYVCHRFDGTFTGKVGNVLKDNKIKIFKIIEETIMEKIKKVDILKECQSCFARYICGGQCYYESGIIDKKNYKLNKDYCRFVRKLVETSIALYSYIPEKLKKILIQRRR
ncbi:radical SAM protein [Thermosipho sp. 1063]|uniref:radical SAM/SPASM domain-containing protein n=1 Tax=unclassified Thermosipho (in: thermotogales) TaxID=2676525 RepID=UPI00094946E8|nr:MULTISPECIES: radical SAM protein [unclassified Thermosipho (in: thermotogales)]ANQ54447.1 radical SAM protein [Thermosipho sp. 1070]APT72891.1 radical SAM protein [Thermosipho sp. 1063]OOC42325.1 hypothetical protein XO08_08620 [Thermosipho sp. 1074]